MKIAHSESQRKFPHISFISESRIRESGNRGVWTEK